MTTQLLPLAPFGDRSGEASTTQLLGEVHRSAGRTGLALDYLRHASAIRRSLPV
ncbi:tetratricopeptide repeat protein [Nonomuraea sp. M3C6]|uniref:Tetratricopeptide repeat protein n=1 Tax=Nonomuraea marmarensis TaxID=3351344 RepID=A0ABW7AC49_9ACTN